MAKDIQVSSNLYPVTILVNYWLYDLFLSSRTKWNRFCTAILRRLLPRLEEIKSGGSRTNSRATEEGSVVAGSVQSFVSDTGSLSDEHLGELRDIMTTYQVSAIKELLLLLFVMVHNKLHMTWFCSFSLQMTGFPIQQAYVNMESVTESVFATGVHTIDTPDVEFAVAAYARSFPAGVYSVWVYIAALHRRKWIQHYQNVVTNFLP